MTAHALSVAVPSAAVQLCPQLYSEKTSGKSTNGRHALNKAIKMLRPGDTLVTVGLDRLARSIRDLLSLRDTIKAADAYIKALDDPWLDTTTPHGELILGCCSLGGALPGGA